MRELDGRQLRMVLPTVVVLVLLVGVTNLVLDRATDASAHAVFELTTYLGALGVSCALWLGWWRAHERGEALRRALRERRDERDRWRASAQRMQDGLPQRMEVAFSSWDLTPAERDVAVLLLKGHSHKAVARLTERSERTVRQHAVSVYQKSRMGGRAELAAHFLDELTSVVGDGEEGANGEAGKGHHPRRAGQAAAGLRGGRLAEGEEPRRC